MSVTEEVTHFDHTEAIEEVLIVAMKYLEAIVKGANENSHYSAGLEVQQALIHLVRAQDWLDEQGGLTEPIGFNYEE